MQEGEQDFSSLAIRVINSIRRFDTPLTFLFKEDFLCEIGGVEEAKNEVDFIEKLITRLEFYQDELQAALDETKNRKQISSGGLRFKLKQSYVYLMFDERTGYHKIGRSIRPEYRERTLQSEQPNIKMVFVSALTFSAYESKLHGIFKEKRVRGEWFNLSEQDVDYIRNFNFEPNAS